MSKFLVFDDGAALIEPARVIGVEAGFGNIGIPGFNTNIIIIDDSGRGRNVGCYCPPSKVVAAVLEWEREQAAQDSPENEMQQKLEATLEGQ